MYIIFSVSLNKYPKNATFECGIFINERSMFASAYFILQSSIFVPSMKPSRWSPIAMRPVPDGVPV